MAAQQQSLLNVQNNLANVIKNIESNLVTRIDRLENNVIDKTSDIKPITLTNWFQHLSLNIKYVKYDIKKNINNSSVTFVINDAPLLIDAQFYRDINQIKIKDRITVETMINPGLDIDPFIFITFIYQGLQIWVMLRIIEPYETRTVYYYGAAPLYSRLIVKGDFIKEPVPIYLGDFIISTDAVVYDAICIVENSHIYSVQTVEWQGLNQTPGRTKDYGVYKDNIKIPFNTGEFYVSCIQRHPYYSDILLATVSNTNSTKLVTLNEITYDMVELVNLNQRRSMTYNMQVLDKKIYISLSIVGENTIPYLTSLQNEEINISDEIIDRIGFDSVVVYDIEESKLETVLKYDKITEMSTINTVGGFCIINNMIIVSKYSLGAPDIIQVYNMSGSLLREKVLMTFDIHGDDPWLEPGMFDKEPYIYNGIYYVLMTMKSGLMFVNINNLDDSKFVSVCSIPDFSIYTSYPITVGKDVIYKSNKKVFRVNKDELFSLATNKMVGAYGDIFLNNNF